MYHRITQICEVIPRGECFGYTLTPFNSPLPLPEADSGATELLLPPVNLFHGENVLGPPGFEARTPA